MPTPSPRQSSGLIEPHAPDRWAGPDDRDAVRHWQSLVDRRLIGTTPPLDPITVAAIRAAEAALGVRRPGGIW